MAVRRAFNTSTSFQNITTTAVAGLVLAFLQMMLSFSLGSLLFSGALETHIATGVAIMLQSTILGFIIFAFLASDSEIVPAVQSSLTLILAAIGSTIAISSNKGLLPTMLVVISASAVILGVAFFLFGYFKLTKFARYIPYPVIGGFLAGNGVLLIEGAVQVMTGSEFSLSMLAKLFDGSLLISWLPGVLIAVALFASLRLSNNILLFPAILILSSVIMYAAIFATGSSVTDATSHGVLLGDIGRIQWQPLTAIDFSDVDWSAIGGQLGNVITLIMVALIHLPLNLKGIEVIKRSDFDIDRQVQSNGIMNLLLGLTGGTTSFSSSTMTAMNHRLQGSSRWVYLIAAAFVLVVLFTGSALLRYVPVSVLGGLLIFLGLEFINTWVIQGYRKFTTIEYIVALLIMLCVVFVGFLESVLLGVFVMVLVFVATYSRISIVYRAAYGGNLASTVEWSPYFTKALRTLRNQIYVLELTGFLFFGTADSIVSHVKDRLEDDKGNNIKFLILDFRRVAGVDSSALQSLDKVIMLAEAQNVTVIFSNFDNNDSVGRIVEELDRHEQLKIISELDYAIEFCENKLLASSGITKRHFPSVIWMQLQEMGMKKAQARKLQRYMERQVYEPGQVIIERDQASDKIFFVESGFVSVYLDYGSEYPVRLRALGMGSVVGEMGFFLGYERSATVVADIQSFVWSLSVEQLAEMEAQEPELRLAFEAMMLRIVAQRLTKTNNLIAALR